MNYDDKQSLFSELYDCIGERLTKKDYNELLNISNSWNTYPRHRPLYNGYYIVVYASNINQYDICYYDIDLGSFKGAKSEIIAWKSFEKYI